MIDCGACGSALSPTRLDGLYGEDDESTCSECGAVNIIGVEESINDEDDGSTCEAYVCHWRCKHGVSEDGPCWQCDEAQGGTAP